MIRDFFYVYRFIECFAHRFEVRKSVGMHRSVVAEARLLGVAHIICVDKARRWRGSN
jgi:hypothetical protein